MGAEQVGGRTQTYPAPCKGRVPTRSDADRASAGGTGRASFTILALKLSLGKRNFEIRSSSLFLSFHSFLTAFLSSLSLPPCSFLANFGDFLAFCDSCGLWLSWGQLHLHSSGLRNKGVITHLLGVRSRCLTRYIERTSVFDKLNDMGISHCLSAIKTWILWATYHERIVLCSCKYFQYNVIRICSLPLWTSVYRGVKLVCKTMNNNLSEQASGNQVHNISDRRQDTTALIWSLNRSSIDLTPCTYGAILCHSLEHSSIHVKIQVTSATSRYIKWADLA